jgi:hypothetical protein
MKQEIDFLKGQRSEREKRLKLLRSVKVGSIIILMAFVLVVGAVFSYWFYINSQNQKIVKENNIKKTKIETLKELESLQTVLKQRLLTMNKFFKEDKRPQFIKTLTFFSQIPQGIALKELSLTNGDNMVNISGDSTDILNLTAFLEKLESQESQDIFSEITVSSLNKKEKEGGYSFSLLLQTKN